MLKQNVMELLEQLEAGGIDTGPLVALWEKAAAIRREYGGIPAQPDASQFFRCRSDLESAVGRNDHAAIEDVQRELEALAVGRKKSLERRKGVTERLTAAYNKAAGAVREVLLQIIENCGVEMARIVGQYRDRGLDCPELLPDSLVDLAKRAKWAAALLDNPAIGSSEQDAARAGWRARPDVRSPFTFIRNRSAREAARARARIGHLNA
jgi:hypothetical protein